MNFFNKFKIARKIAADNAKTYAAAGAIGVIIAPDEDFAFLEAGQLMEVHRLTQLSVSDLKSTLYRGGKPEILDVRSDDEWKSTEIPESKNIPLAQLTSRVSELSSAKPLVVVCQNGYRSAVASSWLQAYGFDNVQYLLGGMDAYASAPLNECVVEFA